jgi:hypothetical protein
VVREQILIYKTDIIRAYWTLIFTLYAGEAKAKIPN